MLQCFLRVARNTAFFEWIAKSFASDVIINYTKLLLHLNNSFVTAAALVPGIWKENVKFLCLLIISFLFVKMQNCVTALCDGRL